MLQRCRCAAASGQSGQRLELGGFRRLDEDRKRAMLGTGFIVTQVMLCRYATAPACRQILLRRDMGLWHRGPSSSSVKEVLQGFNMPKGRGFSPHKAVQCLQTTRFCHHKHVSCQASDYLICPGRAWAHVHLHCTGWCSHLMPLPSVAQTSRWMSGCWGGCPIQQ